MMQRRFSNIQYQDQPQDNSEEEEVERFDKEDGDEQDIQKDEQGQQNLHVDKEMGESCTESESSAGEYEGPIINYDPELPVMDVGSQFPNANEFRNALRQAALHSS
ncbi:hypothetical protein QJS10_CPA09g01275 [Acorus calamus]|uniref:Uncharacterized protein n=1 Tax=Acorus calamus TaxID=4465 RepID=A0AAV9E3Z4_ACOCL|nr:hypothetical protein QJS10_CPA09g01275 [Acorus calamus]